MLLKIEQNLIKKYDYLTFKLRSVFLCLIIPQLYPLLFLSRKKKSRIVPGLSLYMFFMYSSSQIFCLFFSSIADCFFHLAASSLLFLILSYSFIFVMLELMGWNVKFKRKNSLHKIIKHLIFFKSLDRFL